MNGVVLYASVAQSGLARVGPPWFLLLGHFRDHGVSFGDGFVALGPQPGIPTVASSSDTESGGRRSR